MISLREYKRSINGYQIKDCVVRNKDYFHFIGRNRKEAEKSSALSEWKVTKREIGFYKTEPFDDRLGNQEFDHFSQCFIGSSQSGVENPVVVISDDREVYSRGNANGHNDMEREIPMGKHGPMRGIVSRVRMIDGHLYVCGAYRSVCRRKGVNNWESLCYDLPIPSIKDLDNIDLLRDMDFLDIDGFNESDMYVVGGKGIVWHLQDQHWRQIAFPSNMLLESVCCGGDGYVYIGAQSGTIFKGRGDQWEMIYRGNMSLPFKDMVWHQGQLWCTSDYGLWTLQGKTPVRADVPSEVYVCAGNLSVGDGVLLVAGYGGAAFHDGQQWQLIFNDYAMQQQLEKEQG